MKYILIVTLLNGGTFEWATFDNKVDAECHKTRLYEWNKNSGYGLLRKRGFDIPKTWSAYNDKVKVEVR